jgi:hypothetical protein
MLQRTLPVTHPPMPLGKTLVGKTFVDKTLVDKTFGTRRRVTARRRFRIFADRALLILRRLGEFFAAGGPLS